MEENKAERHIRGGMATKHKYENTRSTRTEEGLSQSFFALRQSFYSGKIPYTL